MLLFRISLLPDALASGFPLFRISSLRDALASGFPLFRISLHRKALASGFPLFVFAAEFWGAVICCAAHLREGEAHRGSLKGAPGGGR